MFRKFSVLFILIAFISLSNCLMIQHSLSSRTENRIKMELNNYEQNPSQQFTVFSEDDPAVWSVQLKGPQGTPYEGGTFIIRVTFPEEYPLLPPKIRFITRIYHPNINVQNGIIEFPLLRDQWSTNQNIQKAIKSVIEVLKLPNPQDPSNTQASNQYKQDKNQFQNKAKQWTEQYAK